MKSQRITRLKPLNVLHISLAITLVSALTAIAVGETRQIGHVPYYYMQYLPVNALREEPINSLINLHSQLPLENIIFAGIVNIFRFNSNTPTYITDFWKQDTYWIGILIKQLLFLWLTIYSTLNVLFKLLPKKIGILIIAAFALLPSTLMYFLFPYSALMTASIYCALASNIITQSSSKKRILISALCISALGLSHNLLSYYTTFPFIIAISLEIHHKKKKLKPAFISTVLIILILPAIWAFKNYYLFGITNLTSWSGCALGQSITPIVKDMPGIDPKRQNGWKIAFNNIQREKDYNPNLKIDSPMVLKQRMKGEGVRNWNHESVIESCKISKEYNTNLLANNQEIRVKYIKATYTRLVEVTGRIGSEFNCSGCNFSYNDLGFRKIGNLVKVLNQISIKPLAVRSWNILILLISPLFLGLRLFKSQNSVFIEQANYFLAFALTNSIVTIMAVGLSTIENERMIWMLHPGSNLVFIATVVLTLSRLRTKRERSQFINN